MVVDGFSENVAFAVRLKSEVSWAFNVELKVNGIVGPNVMRLVTERPGAGVSESEAPNVCKPVPGVTTKLRFNDANVSRIIVELAERLVSDSVESKLATSVKGNAWLVKLAEVSWMGNAAPEGDAKLNVRRPRLLNVACVVKKNLTGESYLNNAVIECVKKAV